MKTKFRKYPKLIGISLEDDFKRLESFIEAVDKDVEDVQEKAKEGDESLRFSLNTVLVDSLVILANNSLKNLESNQKIIIGVQI